MLLGYAIACSICIDIIYIRASHAFTFHFCNYMGIHASHTSTFHVCNYICIYYMCYGTVAKITGPEAKITMKFIVVVVFPSKYFLLSL